MRYCVAKDTGILIVASLFSDEVILRNVHNVGFSDDQVEILSQAEYDARESLKPQPSTEPSDKERITELEQVINMILMGNV